MSKKKWFYVTETSDVGGYQEITFERENHNSVIIQVENPEKYSVCKENNYQKITLAIDAQEFDKLAIAWCKKRKLHGALGGPVGREYGSPDYLDE
ncbi:hypothetical protein J7384_05610 [Endozoicomonas sp. G2_1]|uniref:hypothetical protein n=1 Tax=Endozoicomonas sp. G2_1 TaxID=2821091 RepID=UPI001ADB0639|nr:hypothetical protein [Endozoicomonas sp. G2_1]MBO9489832.1 hypothetical protein [Endozoicomonas sp. G2_1]